MDTAVKHAGALRLLAGNLNQFIDLLRDEFFDGITDLANTIDYLTKAVGKDDIGLGGDVNGIGDNQWPADIRHAGELPHLTAELLRRGYSRERLRKLYYDNWRRVYVETLPRAERTASVVPSSGPTSRA